MFGGRIRKVGTLLGRGMTFEQAMAELYGITLESIVITTRIARAVRTLIRSCSAKASDFPLLLHIDDIINNNVPVNIPWDDFETEQF